MNKVIIFDWSGTLSDSFYSFSQVCESMFREIGREPLSEEEIKRNFTLPYMKFWNKYFPDLSKEEQCELYEKHVHKVNSPEPYEGVEELIKFLYKSDWKIFILSSDPLSTLIPETKKTNFSHLFESILGNVYEKGPKIISLIDEFNLNRKMTYYVGDTSGDIDAGKEACIKTIGVSWGFQHKEVLAKAKPDFLINDLIEIEDILKKV